MQKEESQIKETRNNPLDHFFDILAKTNSVEKAKEALRIALQKRKLSVVGDEKSYEELKEEFCKIKKMIFKSEILSKMKEK